MAFAGAWGGRDQLARVFGAVRTSLADDTLPPLPADVCALMEVFTWAQVADVMRIAESSQTHDGLAVPKSAMGHQMLRLVLGGDSPSPQQLRDATLRKALVRLVQQPFEKEALVEVKRAKKAGGQDAKYDLPAARATVASGAPWSAPADVSLLRTLMRDPKGAAASLGAAIASCRATPSRERDDSGGEAANDAVSYFQGI